MITNAEDVAMIDRALSLDNLTTDQRRAFESMRVAITADTSLVLSPRQRLWLDGVLNRCGSIGLTALKTIVSNLDKLGAKP